MRCWVANLLLPFAVMPCVAAQAPGPATTPSYVDGAKNPELIPLNVAFKMMFMHCADGAVLWDLDTRLSYLKSSNLSKEQMLRVIEAGNEYWIALNKFTRAVKKLPLPRDPKAIRSLLDELDRRQEEIRYDLETDLGPAAYQKLLDFVNTKVKSDISIGVPPR
jgi:hypothetical protein